MTDTATPASILDFWLGEGFESGWPGRDMGKQWFGGTPELDRQIADRFGAAVRQALDGGLGAWEADPLDRLALVILLDQFPRNIHRGQARAFAGDARAQQLVRDALAQGMDDQLPWVGRMFLYMPLMHAEDLPLQEEGVRRFRQLAADAPEDLRVTLTSSLRFAEQHRDIIARLGRFPYRNNALGRTSTALEFEFLKTGPRFGQ
ncbi:MAG: DUF924 family protein [Polaromonas sp.]|uniref:DUF924 family protein n=1 Tax=Polaromonas sp. TaxID=1869339 RepID=UPI0040353EC1